MAERNKNADIEEKLKECQEYHYGQSSKVSNLARNVVYGIIGTLWLLIYADSTYRETCLWIKIALGLSFVYLLLDLTHYFWDACDYRKEYFKLDKERAEEDILERHERYMDGVSKRSYRLLKAKFVSVIIISIVFLIAVSVQFGIYVSE